MPAPRLTGWSTPYSRGGESGRAPVPPGLKAGKARRIGASSTFPLQFRGSAPPPSGPAYWGIQRRPGGQLDDAIAALDLMLDPSGRPTPESSYRPYQAIGFS